MGDVQEAKVKQAMGAVADGMIADLRANKEVRDNATVTPQNEKALREFVEKAGTKLAQENPEFITARPEDQARMIVSELRTHPQEYPEAAQALQEVTASVKSYKKILIGDEGVHEKIFTAAEESLGKQLQNPDTAAMLKDAQAPAQPVVAAAPEPVPQPAPAQAAPVEPEAPQPAPAQPAVTVRVEPLSQYPQTEPAQPEAPKPENPAQVATASPVREMAETVKTVGTQALETVRGALAPESTGALAIVVAEQTLVQGVDNIAALMTNMGLDKEIKGLADTMKKMGGMLTEAAGGPMKDALANAPEAVKQAAEAALQAASGGKSI